MQDRFKFRFFNKSIREMSYPKEVCLNKANNIIPMQSTGLKDKNGKLIYENDVVKLAGEGVDNTHIVKFGDFAMYSLDFQTAYEIGSTAVYGWYLGGLKYPVPLSISLDTSGLVIEVIGNIYENPELVEAKNV